MSAVAYHGGVPGLRRGDLILPPSATGVRPTADWAPHLESPYRNDRVYLHKTTAGGLLYAGSWCEDSPTVRYGWLYAVAYDEALAENDEDWNGPEGDSISVPWAIVINGRRVTRRERDAVMALLASKVDA